MKKILYILLLLISGAAKAQVDTTAPIQKWYGAGLEYKTLVASGMLRIPRDTFALKQSDSGAIAYKNNSLWKWNGSNWSVISGTGGNFAPVATTGDYNDLINTPTIPDISGKLNISDTTGFAKRNWVTSLFPRIDTLHQIAFSGSYTDLSNKPTIPTNNNQLDNGAGYLSGSDTNSLSDRIDAHSVRTDNPHNVTLAQVGYDSATDHANIWPAINLRATKTYVDDGLASKASTSHTHAFSDITSGTSNLAVKNADNNFVGQTADSVTVSPTSSSAYPLLVTVDGYGGYGLGLNWRTVAFPGDGNSAVHFGGNGNINSIGTLSIYNNNSLAAVFNNGALRLNQYTAGFLKADASGNVITDNSTYAASTHTHAQSDITNLTTDLAGKQAQLNGTGLVRMSGTTASYDNSSYVKRLFVNNTSASHTGNTTETTVYSYTIPAGTMGANSSLHIPFLITWTNNANAKTFRIRINNTIVAQYAPTTNATGRFYFIISNRNSLTSQITGGATGQSTNLGFNAAITGGVATYGIDFSQSQTITFTIQLGNGADTGAFEMLEGTLYP